MSGARRVQERWRCPLPAPSPPLLLLLCAAVLAQRGLAQGGANLAAADAARALPPPRLAAFKVLGLLPSNKQLPVPFDPPFDGADTTIQDFVCKLDNAMEYFTVLVDARPPAVLSKLDLDGVPVLSRDNLTHTRLAPKQRMVFDVAVTDAATRRFTLVVERRAGSSLELLGLRPVSAQGQRFAIPFHPGELQPAFQAEQSFHEDEFIIEYDFADGGQEIECRVDGLRTIGPDAPSRGQMALHPHRYKPSLEQLGRLTEETIHNLNSPGAGPTRRCRVPIDTWRQIEVGLYIRAADKVSHRHIRINVTRKGCAEDTFYHLGACLEHCPTFHYPQSFNWRCGRCSRHCEFCEHWARCMRCQRNTTMYSYAVRDDGSCLQLRVHAFKVYYDLAWYLAVACGSLFALYALICAGCLCRRMTARADLATDAAGGGGPRRRGFRGAEAASAEERQPLTAAGEPWGRSGDAGGRSQASVGAGGLLRGHRLLSAAE